MRYRENLFGTSLLALSLAAAPQTPSTTFKATIEGTVRDAATNQPLEGVNLYVQDPAQRTASKTLPAAVSNAQGQFRIEVSGPGSYRLVPQRSGFVYARPSQMQTFQLGIVVAAARDRPKAGGTAGLFPVSFRCHFLVILPARRIGGPYSIDSYALPQLGFPRATCARFASRQEA